MERGQDGDRDLKLVDAALAALRKKYAVDDDRICATGFSNGAAFTYLLWAERPDVFAAYAVVAGRLRPSVHPRVPRPLLAVVGERDPQPAWKRSWETGTNVDCEGTCKAVLRLGSRYRLGALLWLGARRSR